MQNSFNKQLTIDYQRTTQSPCVFRRTARQFPKKHNTFVV